MSRFATWIPLALLAAGVAGCPEVSIAVGERDGGGGESVATAGAVAGGEVVTSSGVTIESGDADSDAAGDGVDSVTGRVLARVNEERAAVGAPALARNALLDAAAAAHAADMVDSVFFSHTGTGGSTPAERVAGQGYSWSTVGENIAYGPSDADDVMDMWMNSSGHRANILNAAFTEIGIALDDRGTPYWVQVFAAPQ